METSNFNKNRLKNRHATEKPSVVVKYWEQTQVSKKALNAQLVVFRNNARGKEVDVSGCENYEST